MNTGTTEELSFDVFNATFANPACGAVATAREPAQNLWPVVGYLVLEGAERAATFSATSWGEFPQ